MTFLLHTRREKSKTKDMYTLAFAREKIKTTSKEPNMRISPNSGVSTLQEEARLAQFENNSCGMMKCAILLCHTTYNALRRKF